MKTVAIIQARMTSTRLPGKVLLDLGGAPMLERQLARLRHARSLDEIAVATTTNATDDPVAELATRLGAHVFRGSEHDVLARYVGAAEASSADIVVRITADCPLIDAELVDDVVNRLIAENVDYAANDLIRTFPRGLDVEAMTREALETCHRLAASTPSREHVTWFIRQERPDLFRSVNVASPDDNSQHRWTVDTPEDFAVVRAIFEGLGLAERYCGYREILKWIGAHPELAELNRAIAQKHS